MPVLAVMPSKAPAVGAWSTTDSISSSMASRFSSGGGAGFAFCRFSSGLVGVPRFLEKVGENSLFSVTFRFPERALFQWLDTLTFLFLISPANKPLGVLLIYNQ